MQNLLLQVKGLSKNFNTFKLGPLDLYVKQGIVTGLVGANGSGKTTLFRLLMKLMKEDAGHIQFFGRNWTENESTWKEKVGYAGELLDAYDFLPIKELKKLISPWYPNWNNQQFEYLSKRYQINLEEKYEKCSNGTKKKIDFIFALCHDPSLLLLDEPTAGVDIVSRRKMKEDLIRFMEDDEKSIVLATHTIDEINQLCDEIIVLDSGKIIHSYNKDDIYDNWARVWISNLTQDLKNHPNVIHYELTPPQIVTNHMDELESVLQAEQITSLQVQRLSMEEVLEYIIEYS
ncbi:ABC-2 type transport system ATP-binding protein [Salinibacillus kushneri]|uniref:ABC-2 type transport system ATP-binding protein n=1 Tax=Salinibacillus kushneri TaxID=237682 RepID=A0A1I0F6J9_9BACI|nr:ABC transporter ATP-binding protein [Salinibacillus kushneri]SET53748.1 ABC-2 type transport system ATP-binding protein [Salinibacillus kushneri]